MSVTASAATAQAVVTAINTTISAIDKAAKLKELMTPGSIIEVSADSRVVAPCIWERDLYFSESRTALANCIRTAENLYTGFYLLALNNVMPVGKIDAKKTLSSISPNRNAGGLSGLSKLVMQDYYGDKELVFLDAAGLPEDSSRLTKYQQDRPAAYDDKVIDSLNKEANALTGKYLMVTLTDGEASMKMPLNISLATANTDPKVLVNMLSAAGNQNGFNSRWHRYMAGELTFWKDLVLSSDLVREHKRNARLDKEGLQKAVNSARLRAAKAALATNVKSSGAIAITYIISKRTADAIERQAAGSLQNFALRQNLMNEAMAMQLFVLDEAEEMITVYFHSIERPTTVSYKQLEKSNPAASSGGDLLAVLQSLKTGNIPQIR